MNAPARAALLVNFSFVAGVFLLLIPSGAKSVTPDPVEPGVAVHQESAAEPDVCEECRTEPGMVAIFLPVSGPRSNLGMVVHDELLQKLAGVPGIRLAVFDTYGTLPGTRRAFMEALGRRPELLVGGIGDRETIELATLAIREDIPLLTLGRSSLPAGSGLLLQVAPSRATMAGALLDAVSARNAAPGCAMAIRLDDPFGEAEASAFRQALAARGIPFAGTLVAGRAGDDEGDFAARATRALDEFRTSHACNRTVLHLIMDVAVARRLVDYLRFAGFFDLEGVSVLTTGTALLDAPGLVAQSGSSLRGTMFVDVDVQTSFGGRDDLFRAEMEDLAAFAGVLARDLSVSVTYGWKPPEGVMVSGRTGKLSFEGGRILGHSLKVCVIGDRGVDCSPFEQAPARDSPDPGTPAGESPAALPVVK